MGIRVFVGMESLLLIAGMGLGAAFGQAPPKQDANVGFGADTPGGYGGQVLRVTTLEERGPGSLRAALETKGPRIVVFEVAGVIDLKGRSLGITDPFVTVAGQTAPAPGISIIRGAIYIATHDVRIRHLRVRPGDNGRPKRSGWEPDGISTSGKDAHDIVIEQCSVTWATDENVSVSGPRLDGPEATSRRVTIRNCIIAEALHNSSHAKGPHSMGSLIHDFCQDVAILGNLYAHNNARNPYFKAHTTGVIVNNVIYNPGSQAIQLGYSPAEWLGAKYAPRPPRLSIVGNVYIPGADTRRGLAMIGRPGEVFLADNIAHDHNGSPTTLVGPGVVLVDQKPAWPTGLQPLPAEEVLEFVARHSGARPRDRDGTDRRIIDDLLNRGGRIIDSQDEVGGYPTVDTVHRVLVVPEGASAVESWLARLAAEVE